MLRIFVDISQFHTGYQEMSRTFESLNNVVNCCLTGKSSPVTGLEWPRGFQEVKVPRFHDNGTGWW
jgi:hypothetical protein